MEVSEPASPGRTCSIQALKRVYNFQQKPRIIREKEVLGTKEAGGGWGDCKLFIFVFPSSLTKSQHKMVL